MPLCETRLILLPPITRRLRIRTGVMPLRIFGIAAAQQHHPPGLAPAFAMHADLADFDGHVAVVVDAPPATCSRLGPDAGRDIGHDAPLDDVVPSAPLPYCGASSPSE